MGETSRPLDHKVKSVFLMFVITYHIGEIRLSQEEEMAREYMYLRQRVEWG